MVSLALLDEIAPISGHVPELKVDALCKVRSAGDKLMGLPEAQSIADCVREMRSNRRRKKSVAKDQREAHTQKLAYSLAPTIAGNDLFPPDTAAIATAR